MSTETQYALPFSELLAKDLTWADWQTWDLAWEQFHLLGTAAGQDDARTINIKLGEPVFCAVSAETVDTFTNLTALTYNTADLLLEQVVQNASGLPEQLSGKVAFHCSAALPTGMDWTGTVALLKFKALKTGQTTLKLQ